MGRRCPIDRERGNAGQIEAVDQTRQLELVGEREGDHREVADGTARLVGADRLAAAAGVPHVVGEEGALGRATRAGR